MYCLPSRLYYLIAPADYITFSRVITLDSGTTSAHLTILIIDDLLCDADESFEILLTSLSNCIITTSPVPVNIIDNDGRFLII